MDTSQGQGPSDDGQGQGSPEGQQGQQPPAPGGQASESDDSKATIARLNQEAKANRERAEAAERKLKEHEDTKLSETEKAAQRLSALESEKSSLETDLQEARAERAVERAARKAGAVHPETTYRLVDRSEVEFDSAGKVTNAEALVKKAKEAYPEFFGKGSADGGPQGDDPKSKTDMNAALRLAATGR